VILLIAEHNRMGFMLGIPGLALQFVGNFMSSSIVEAMGAPGAIVAGVVSLGGTALLIAGLCYVAMAKGYHWGLGFLGLLSCVGLLILGVLPDKTKNMPPAGFGGPMPPPGGIPQWGPQGSPPVGGYGAPPPNNPYAPPQGGGWGGPQGGPPPQGGGWGGPQGGPPPQGGGWGGPQGGPPPQGGGWRGPPPA
jgi:hypothetical protein